MPSEDFRCRPLRFLLREIFVTKIFIPLIDCLSEPFFVNRMIVWLLSELPLSTDDFVGCLERCNCVQELESILESVHEEICTLKSKGAGSGENNGKCGVGKEGGEEGGYHGLRNKRWIVF